MPNIEPYNIIISGVGGQGVYSITKVLWKLCQMYGIKCQGSILKGGAQRMGTIYSTMRLFLKDYPDYSLYSTHIPKHSLHMIIGLEPWETLRYSEYFNSQTKVFMNTPIYPLFVERYKNNDIENPVKAVMDLGLPTIADNYTAKAIDEFKTKKMANYLIGLDSITKNKLPFSYENYVTAFIDQIPVEKWIENKIRQDLEQK